VNRNWRQFSKNKKNATGPGIGRTALPEGPAYEDDPSHREDHPNANKDRNAEHRYALIGNVGQNSRALAFVPIDADAMGQSFLG
jgi:hypothetical protein